MRKVLMVAVAGVLAISVSACSNVGEKQAFGGLLGAAGGAVAGAQFGKGKGQLAAVAAGTLLGALFGSEAGASMDRADQMYAERQRRLERAGAYGPPFSQPQQPPPHWYYNNQRLYAGPPQYHGPSRQYCREYQFEPYVGGRQQHGYGIACQQPDGSWMIVQ
jgi:surface antigen